MNSYRVHGEYYLKPLDSLFTKEKITDFLSRFVNLVPYFTVLLTNVVNVFYIFQVGDIQNYIISGINCIANFITIYLVNASIG